MKLRNKKTGEIAHFAFVRANGFIDNNSLSELIEEWEDYEEPLIEDEKARKAVREWAKALEANRIEFDRLSQGFSVGDGGVFSSINFDGFVLDLLDGKEYTIDELCGEEE